MAKIIDLPKLSPTMEEGLIAVWHKSEGQPVEVDDLLAEVETDKAKMEFRAFDKGTLLKILVPAGQTAKLGQPVAIFGQTGEDISSLLGNVSGAITSQTKAPVQVQVQSSESSAKTPASAPATESKPKAPVVEAPLSSVYNAVAPTKGVSGLILLPPARRSVQPQQNTQEGPSSPKVRRLARERGVELTAVQGSGPHGRITPEDVQRTQVSPAQEKAPSGPTLVESVAKTASPMRKTIARRLTEAWQQVPHFYLEVDLDVEALVALREQLNEGKEKDQRISINDLLIRACALGLRAVPEANASWIDGSILVHQRVDVSVAVAIDDGLVTPVVRNADQKSARVIALEVKDLAARAKARKLKPEEMQNGVFSISNLGMFGIDRFSAVINPPESMILAVGAVRETPVVKNGTIAVGKRCAVTLSCDHRVVDGALGARFLQAVRDLVSKPLDIIA